MYEEAPVIPREDSLDSLDPTPYEEENGKSAGESDQWASGVFRDGSRRGDNSDCKWSYQRWAGLDDRWRASVRAVGRYTEDGMGAQVRDDYVASGVDAHAIRPYKGWARLNDGRGSAKVCADGGNPEDCMRAPVGHYDVARRVDDHSINLS